MKNFLSIAFSIAFFMLSYLPVQANLAKPALEVFEAVAKRCKPCRNLLKSPVAESLLKRGVIRSQNADEVGQFLSRYGQKGLRQLDLYGEDALKVFVRFGDDGMEHLNRYGDEYLSLLRRESPEAVNRILKHSDGMIFIRESPSFLKNYSKFGDDLIDCVRKNPVCVESVNRTGLSPRILGKLKDRNVTWLEVNMPRLSQKDGNAFREILKNYGDPAIEFTKKHWDTLKKIGVFSIVAVNFDRVMAGGEEVLKKTIEEGAKIPTEMVRVAGEETRKTVVETGQSFGSGFLWLMGTSMAVLFFGYRLLKFKMRPK